MKKEQKGIDWSKDNVYDGIGRPDLKPKKECTCVDLMSNRLCAVCQQKVEEAGFAYDNKDEI